MKEAINVCMTIHWGTILIKESVLYDNINKSIQN